MSLVLTSFSGVEPKIGVENTPKWMVNIMGKPGIKNGMILGGKPTIFGNTYFWETTTSGGIR